MLVDLLEEKLELKLGYESVVKWAVSWVVQTAVNWDVCLAAKMAFLKVERTVS